MSGRDKLLIAGILVCVALTGYIVKGIMSRKTFDEPEGAVKGLHVICTNCKHEEMHFEASVVRTQWPTECPNCGKQTLYMTITCPYCRKTTAGPPEEAMPTTMKCLQCGKEIKFPVGAPPVH